MVTSEMRHQAEALRGLFKVAGETIERLQELGCSVSLEVHFNGGEESVLLHQLNGEFEVTVLRAVEVGEEEEADHA